MQTHTVMKHSSCPAQESSLGWLGRKELLGCLGDSCSLRSRAGIKVSHGHAKPCPVVPGCLKSGRLQMSAAAGLGR